MIGLVAARPAHEEATEAIGRELRAFLESRSRKAAAYGTQFEALWEEAGACILGGKLLRPRLLIELFDVLAADRRVSASRPSVVRIAAAVELLHYSFLLHDDVIDGDLTRRHRPNLIGALLQKTSADAAQDPSSPGRPGQDDALHWARTGGILMGDLMLTAALQAFAREQLPPQMRLTLLDLLDRTITESVAGELLDVGLSDGVIPAELRTVLSMSRLKTATYTFELPMRAAAVLAAAPPGLESAIGEAGRHLGVAFQLQDDLLSTFGAPESHGKDPFSDLREGKETAIIAFARTTPAWPDIAPHFEDFAAGEGEGHMLRTLLTDCGAEEYARSLMEQQMRAGIDALANREDLVPAAVVRFCIRLASSLEGRRA